MKKNNLQRYYARFNTYVKNHPDVDQTTKEQVFRYFMLKYMSKIRHIRAERDNLPKPPILLWYFFEFPSGEVTLVSLPKGQSHDGNLIDYWSPEFEKPMKAITYEQALEKFPEYYL